MGGYISNTSYLSKKRDGSLINRKLIFRVMGVLLLVEVCMFLVCAAVAWGYGEADKWDFLLTAGINYRPLPNLVVKADYTYRMVDWGNYRPEQTVSLGVAFVGWFISK